MTPFEFCYWLQGGIEIGGLSTFNAESACLVIQKLEKIEQHNLFTLSSLLMLRDFEPHSVFNDMHASLQDMFIHDIDPSYEGDQEHFHELHRGTKQRLSPL